VKRAVKILGTGHVLPRQEVLSSDLDKQLGLPQGKLESVGGVHKRFFAGKDEYAAKLAAAAAFKALAAAGLKLSDIDCLVATSATMDQGMPPMRLWFTPNLGFPILLFLLLISMPAAWGF
jgi:3-oxoacyl-[acyl-carrier-protein] synthase-3